MASKEDCHVYRAANLTCPSILNICKILQEMKTGDIQHQSPSVTSNLELVRPLPDACAIDVHGYGCREKQPLNEQVVTRYLCEDLAKCCRDWYTLYLRNLP